MVATWRRVCRNLRGLVPTPTCLACSATLLALAAGGITPQHALISASGQVAAAAPSFDARVEHVVDGDTLDVRRSDGRVIRVRVHGIDCPERGEPFATVARNFTRSMVFRQFVRVASRDTDRYGRLVADVRVGARDLGQSLVEAGLAWQYRRYSDDPHLAELERRAREARRGLWQLEGVSGGLDDTRRKPQRLDIEGSSLSGEVRGNVASRLYHLPSCPNYSCRNCIRVFRNEQEARASGFQPAKDCRR
jgi:micrococcal nuclease